ncbi:actin-like ATPase domain-containing protein [Lasiosphaeria hispida]|uniref:Phosphotransferase n=1 Tax=Lasiosphaeria hispida TaxID=260671 RepID=A0AAJ0HH57_9PEZI|nr:actin-like ATPase domain-containing protein [Lasiosphaeria hispida]
MAAPPPDLRAFLKPLSFEFGSVVSLSQELALTFKHLSAQSLSQFLPTPISESILRQAAASSRGRFLAIDIGGTNLRVAFIELLGGSDYSISSEASVDSQGTGQGARRLKRHLEHSWPIQDHLKNENPENLFSWVGNRVAQVVRRGCELFMLTPGDELPMGVTFSFPMKQNSLSEATLMPMGKGFAITSSLDLGDHLMKGYEKHRAPDMPHIKIAAISNDAVATLVSFVYQFPAEPDQKAVMGLIVGTGCNATIPLKLSSLHPSKWPGAISVLDGQDGADVKIAVNTEWSINGSAPPLRNFGFVTHWDEQLDRAGEAPGFQPLEYMTAGRYLGELARIIFVDTLHKVMDVPVGSLPAKLRQRFGMTTTFISHYYPGSPAGQLLNQLQREFPTGGGEGAMLPRWEGGHAFGLWIIVTAIERRASAIVAAATVALLRCAGEIPDPRNPASTADDGVKELVVGYTGGCIQHFHKYLEHTQTAITRILYHDFQPRSPPVGVTLRPCHDGGITGAGVLVPAALASHVA